jgi:DinB superfamily
MNFASSLSLLFARDLARLAQEVEAFPNDATLWQAPVGITNPGGNLVLHIEGNLREYVGRQLAGLPYIRDRPKEFSQQYLSREDLLARVSGLKQTIPAAIARLTNEQLDGEYPETVLGKPMTVRQFLIHLYGHLNWHLGQIDSARRVLTGEGAIKLAGL